MMANDANTRRVLRVAPHPDVQTGGCEPTTVPLHLTCATVLVWRRKWQPTPLFLPGESHGQRSLGASVHGVT